MRSCNTPGRWALAVVTLAGALASPPVVAQAAHVACGTVITTDTTLDSDLLDCPSGGLHIGADGVTLDLGGHVVDGTNFGSTGVGNLFGVDNVTIRNGVVQQFGTGVWLEQATGNLLEDLELRDNRWGAQLNGAHENVLRALSAHGNTYDGIKLGESSVLDANDNRIEDSRIEQNGESGITVNNSERNVLARNVATANGKHGILLADCCIDMDGNTLVDNRLVDNGTLSSAYSEIGLRYEDGATIEGNDVAGMVELTNSPRATITYNQLGSVFVRNPDQPGELQIHDNLVSGGGIILAHVDDSLVTNNRVLPMAVGIGLDYSERALVADNDVKGGQAGIRGYSNDGRYERNRVSRAEVDGIELAGANIVALDNRALRNGEDGIDVNALPAVIGGNAANHNGAWGIRAAVGATDAGGNRAHANRFRLQCLNVRCN